jgi:hypothetical protein
VAFHGSKIMMMPGPWYKENEGNNHERRPMVGSKKVGKAAKGNKTVAMKDEWTNIIFNEDTNFTSSGLQMGPRTK